MCETEEDERRQQHRRATTGVCERGEALCEDAEQQVRTMILVVRESMRRRYISQSYCRSRQREVAGTVGAEEAEQREVTVRLSE